MKQIIKILMVAGLISSLLNSCYRDKGNYDLIDYNKVLEVVELGETNIAGGDSLILYPRVKWRYPKKDTLGFSYEWFENFTSVSKERILRYLPKFSGTVYFYLNITENATGIKQRHTVQVTVSSKYKDGWLILVNNGGKTELSLVRRITHTLPDWSETYEYATYLNAYATEHPDDPLGSNPKKLITPIFPEYSGRDEILVIQGNNESVFLDGRDLSKQIRSKSEFRNQAFPNGAELVDYLDAGALNLAMFDNGEIYWKRNEAVRGSLHSGTFIPEPMYATDGEKFSMFINSKLTNSAFTFAYDEQNRKFTPFYTSVSSTANYLGTKMNITYSPQLQPYFTDLRDMQQYKLLYCGNYDGNNFINVLKDESANTFYLQTFYASNGTTNLSISNQAQEVFPVNGIASDNSVFFRVPTRNYLFFGEGSKLYFYDLNTKLVHLYRDFGTGRVIKLQTDPIDASIGVALDNGDFYIYDISDAVLGQANPGQKGLIYQAPNLGNIVDMSWKWCDFSFYLMSIYAW